MNPPTRVLVVDDSVVVRRTLDKILSADPDVEVVGTAANGRIALDKLPRLKPDVVVLDVEMPVLDGVETLKQLRVDFPSLPVVMFSAHTERGARVTIDALFHGASDYVTKPSGAGSRQEAEDKIRIELLGKVKSLARHAPSRARSARPPRAPSSAPVSAKTALFGPMEVLAVGSSTGGPNALALFFEELGPSFAVPTVITQHMPPLFTDMLAKRLSTQCRLDVREAKGGELVERGLVLIAPGGQHMVVERARDGVRTRLTDDPPENSCRPAVDVLFRSVAHTYGNGVLAVVLTGMGQDGLLGAERIVEKGGRVFAQDEASSVVWGMPGYVARAGLADTVLPIPGLASEVQALAGKRWGSLRPPVKRPRGQPDGRFGH